MGSGVPARRIEMLRGLPLFDHCTDRELAGLDRLVDEIEVAEGAVLTREGQPGRESFIVVEGEADVVLGGETIATLGPGSFFGELAMLDFRPRSATVTAKTPMRLLVVGPADFSAFLAQPGVAVKMLEVLVERLREMEASR